MRRKDDIVIYENQERNAIELIKELNLSIKWYYKRRAKGQDAQEAFNGCLKSRNKQIKATGVTSIAKANHLSTHTIYQQIDQGKSINQIIEDKEKKQNEINEQKIRQHNMGLPEEYENIHSFCIKNGKDYLLVLNELKKGKTFEEAINTPRKTNRSKLIFLNIQLKSLCLKFNLNYQEVRKKAINNGYIYALTRNLFNQSFTNISGKTANIIWDLYQQYINNIPIDVDSLTLEKFKMLKEKNRIMNRYLNYYQFLSYLPINDLIYLNLDERVRHVLLSQKELDLTVSELYYILDFKNGLMQNFSYFFDGEKSFWTYQPPIKLKRKID